jgi:hypothetical protein
MDNVLALQLLAAPAGVEPCMGSGVSCRSDASCISDVSSSTKEQEEVQFYPAD